MPIVTAQEVKDLLGTLDNMDFTEHVNAAGIVVEEDLVSSGLSDQRKKLVELFLAAHFATLALERGGLKSEEVGESVETYQTHQGDGYNSTRWGQQAMSLDESGILADNANPLPRAEFEVV